MTALTLDHLSGGRAILGLGASGPQVVEGWYGQPYPKPLARTAGVRRDHPAHPRPRGAARLPGRALPGAEPRARARWASASRSSRSPTRCGPTCRSSSAPRGRRTWPWRPRSPTAGCRSSCRPSSTRTTGTAWPRGSPGPAPAGAWTTSRSRTWSRSSIDDDVEAAADLVRMSLGFYIGGMGAREVNFHANLFARMGYETEVEKIQDLFLAGRKDEAIKSGPARPGRGRRARRPDRQDPRGARRQVARDRA